MRTNHIVLTYGALVLMLLTYRSATSQIIDTKFVGGVPDGNGRYENINKFIILENGTMFLNCAKGVYASVNNGVSWKSVAGGKECDFFLADDNTFYVAFASGLFSSTNNGGSWANLNAELPNGPFYSVAANSTAIFTGCGTGLFRSLDGGATWDHIAKTEIPLSSANTPYVMVTKRGTVLLRNGNSYFRSTDNGDSWKNSVPLTIQIYPFSEDNILRFGNSGLERSTDDGVSWKSTPKAPVNSYPGLAQDINGILYTFGGWQLYSSADTAKTWSLVGTISGGEIALGVLPDNTFYYSASSEGIRRTLKPLSGVEREPAHLTSLNLVNNEREMLSFSLHSREFVKLYLVDLQGQIQVPLVAGNVDAGDHYVQIPSERVGNGAYFVVLQTSSERKVLKLILSR
jgi:hypothetical protein